MMCELFLAFSEENNIYAILEEIPSFSASQLHVFIHTDF